MLRKYAIAYKQHSHKLFGEVIESRETEDSVRKQVNNLRSLARYGVQELGIPTNFNVTEDLVDLTNTGIDVASITPENNFVYGELFELFINLSIVNLSTRDSGKLYKLKEIYKEFETALEKDFESMWDKSLPMEDRLGKHNKKALLAVTEHFPMTYIAEALEGTAIDDEQLIQTFGKTLYNYYTLIVNNTLYLDKQAEEYVISELRELEQTLSDYLNNLDPTIEDVYEIAEDMDTYLKGLRERKITRLQ